MDSDKEYEKFVKFKNSVEMSLKSFAMKLGESLKDIRKQIKQIKEEVEINEQKECLKCGCENKTENLETSLKLLETKFHTFEEKLEDKGDRYNNLEKEIQDLQEIASTNRQKIEDIDLKIQSLESLMNNFSASHKSFAAHSKPNKCKHCGVEFSDFETLKTHIKHQHRRIFKCSDCESIFSNSYQLEQHIVNSHKREKQYKCDICELRFLVKWRFSKHVTSHQNVTRRRCHYFNNKKECPYIESGCKYLHETSSMCKYSDSCSKVMCQFRH